MSDAGALPREREGSGPGGFRHSTMNTAVFRFSLAKGTGGVDLTEAQATLRLAILAAEGLFGEACVRMEVSYHTDAPRSAIYVDATTPSGDAVVRIFTAFLSREFGPDRFTVRRLPSPRAETAVVDAGVAA